MPTAGWSDPYKVLQVDPSADQEVISAAYRRLATRYHPDTSSLPPAEAQVRMSALNQAHELVTNPDTRARVDAIRAELADVERLEGVLAEIERRSRAPARPSAREHGAAVGHSLRHQPNKGEGASAPTVALASDQRGSVEALIWVSAAYLGLWLVGVPIAEPRSPDPILSRLLTGMGEYLVVLSLQAAIARRLGWSYRETPIWLLVGGLQRVLRLPASAVHLVRAQASARQ